MGKKNSKLKIITIFLIQFIIISLVILPMIANGSTSKISNSVWNLTSWNEDNAVNWFSKGLFIESTIGSNASYNVLNENPNNMTHPNSGQFSIGNITNLETDNADIASALTLSIWPWLPGILTHTNWTYHKLEAENAANSQFLQGELTITENVVYTFDEFERSAIKFKYQQNISLGNQNTTLIYDLDTGLLLSGQSEIAFGSLYLIQLELIESTLITSSNTNSGFVGVGFSLYDAIASLIIALSFLSMRYKRKRQ